MNLLQFCTEIDSNPFEHCKVCKVNFEIYYKTFLCSFSYECFPLLLINISENHINLMQSERFTYWSIKNNVNLVS